MLSSLSFAMASNPLVPQKDSLVSPSWSLGIKSQYGFIISHHKEMQVFTNHHFPVFQIEIARSSTGRKAWQQQYNYPHIGLSYLYSPLGNSPILGDVHALYPFLDFPLSGNHKSGLVLRFGGGLSYFEKCFDRLDNYKNSAIGSHINSVVDFELMYSAAFDNGLRLKTGMAFTHFSNGSSKMPNFGINVLTAGVSVAYNFINKVEMHEAAQIEDPKKGLFEFYTLAYAGKKEIQPVDGPQYLIANMGFNALYYYRDTRKLGVGLDFVYDDSDVELLRREGKVLEYRYQYIKPGIKAMHEWQISRFSISLQFGVYLIQEENSDGIFYDVVALNYLVGKHFLLNISLKSHFAKADCVGLGLGFKL